LPPPTDGTEAQQLETATLAEGEAAGE